MEVSSVGGAYLQASRKPYSAIAVNNEISEKRDNVDISKAGKEAVIKDDAKLEHLALPPWMEEYMVMLSPNLGGSTTETYGSKLVGNSDNAKREYGGLVHKEFQTVLQEAGITDSEKYYMAVFADSELSKIMEQQFLDKIDLLNEQISKNGLPAKESV
ncbi:MAG: hypothetical protein HRU05_16140 [Oceanospirillaceae bacterium]|nr:hypothetical protein [Oceanospirillaceae bacterium]